MVRPGHRLAAHRAAAARRGGQGRRQQGLPAHSVQWGVLGDSGMVARQAGLGRYLLLMAWVAPAVMVISVPGS